ncbi:hypothetical protein BDV98DRAFT_562486 [Pterulicium gracile]|uniref:Uncharacterized protein n=1 Tax=Pterulicium gracile TaxID=1884261 RepID=A0A5C3R1H9_9AGAR|nr:hypothetical protein BDV98DRAFT_562486 [Pterula gracilis]
MSFTFARSTENMALREESLEDVWRLLVVPSSKVRLGEASELNAVLMDYFPSCACAPLSVVLTSS